MCVVSCVRVCVRHSNISKCGVHIIGVATLCVFVERKAGVLRVVGVCGVVDDNKMFGGSVDRCCVWRVAAHGDTFTELVSRNANIIWSRAKESRTHRAHTHTHEHNEKHRKTHTSSMRETNR